MASPLQFKISCHHQFCQCDHFIAITSTSRHKNRSCICGHSITFHTEEGHDKETTVDSVFVVAAYALLGTDAVPIRLKILLDRLFSVLRYEEVLKVLRAIGWSYENYARGYIFDQGSIQDGKPTSSKSALLTRWTIMPLEEEVAVLKVFRDFAETKPLVDDLMNDSDEGVICSKEPTKLDHVVAASTTSSMLPSPVNLPASRPNQELTQTSPKNELVGLHSENSAFDASVSAMMIDNNLSTISVLNEAFGGTVTSPGGRKRVKCSSCVKTFCDRGALKIHYSAIHLKEQHKCWRPGCSMIFSSVRSRNRHSENPNPRLHGSPASNDVPVPSFSGTQPMSLLSQLSHGIDSQKNQSSLPSRPISLTSSDSTQEVEHMSSPDEMRLNKRKASKPQKYLEDSISSDLIPFYEQAATMSPPVTDVIDTIETSCEDAVALVEEIKQEVSEPTTSSLDFMDEPSISPQALYNEFALKASPISSVPQGHHSASPNNQQQQPLGDDDQTILVDGDIPSDPLNPRSCVTCGRTFHTHFGMRIHYRNVHQRIMHKCKVPGCGAEFNSTRSRDRHSQNVNLHRKLLAHFPVLLNNSKTILLDQGALLDKS